MLDLVKAETERIDARVLEPAWGSGNFLVPVLRRKLAAVELKFGGSEFEKRHYALLGLMCVYGIELLDDNVAECRTNMLESLADHIGLDEGDELHQAAAYVLSQNVIHGDALTMRTHTGQPITFAVRRQLPALHRHRLPPRPHPLRPVRHRCGPRLRRSRIGAAPSEALSCALLRSREGVALRERHLEMCPVACNSFTVVITGSSV